MSPLFRTTQLFSKLWPGIHAVIGSLCDASGCIDSQLDMFGFVKDCLETHDGAMDNTGPNGEPDEAEMFLRAA